MWRDIDRHVELSTLLRRQDLLTDEVDQPLALFVPGDDREVGIDARECDLVGCNLGRELPLVEREVPIRFVEDDFACPGNGLFDAGFYKVLGEAAPETLVDQIELKHAGSNR